MSTLLIRVVLGARGAPQGSVCPASVRVHLCRRNVSATLAPMLCTWCMLSSAACSLFSPPSRGEAGGVPSPDGTESFYRYCSSSASSTSTACCVGTQLSAAGVAASCFGLGAQAAATARRRFAHPETPTRCFRSLLRTPVLLLPPYLSPNPSFKIGRLHITVLNSWDEARGKDTRQMQWLNTDLQAATRQTDLVDFIIVMFHHAPYSRGARVKQRHTIEVCVCSGGRVRTILMCSADEGSKDREEEERSLSIVRTLGRSLWVVACCMSCGVPHLWCQACLSTPTPPLRWLRCDGSWCPCWRHMVWTL